LAFYYGVQRQRPAGGSILLANGTRTSSVYDAAGQLLRLANLNADLDVLSQFDYTYDGAGNRVGVVEADARRGTWSYDPAGQLIGEQRSGPVSFHVTYAYDAVGNRLWEADVTQGRTTHVYGAGHQLQRSMNAAGVTTYAYDADGNRLTQATSSALTSYVWDAQSRLLATQESSGPRFTFAYNPVGQRTRRESAAETRQFVYDQLKPLLETEASGQTALRVAVHGFTTAGRGRVAR